MRLFLFLAATLMLAGCAGAPGPEPPAYYVMRHLHTPEGERDPDLTEEGRQRAALLAEWLPRRVRTILVSGYARSRQTAEPLAARLGLTPIVYDAADTEALVARARRERGPVLIVGHSNTVPDIVERLGGERPAPLVHENFGDVWAIGRNGGTQRLRLPAPASR